MSPLCPLHAPWPAPAARLVRLLALLLALLGLAGAAANAATYTASASAATAASYPWIDISSSGTALAAGDDVISAAVSLGFNFTLGSSTYTTVRIDSNGNLQFASATSRFSHAALPLDGRTGVPSIDAMLMPLWDDLNPGANQMRYRTLGSSPNRVFVVSWLSAPYYGANSGQTATFQVQLHEQGQIVYRYGAVDGSGGAHANADSLTSPSGSAIGMEVSNTDYLQFSRNTASVPSGTTIVFTRDAGAVPAPALAYLFNESRWNGTSGEVRDSSASALHGTAAGLAATLPSTATASPAVGSSTGTCGYGVFNRSNKDHVSLPAGVANFGSSGSFTATAWIRSTNAALSGQRILADDQNNTSGWGVSLGDAGSGTLRFYTRGTASRISVDTGAVITSNTWYFIAFGVDTVSKTKRIWVYDSGGNQLAAVSASYTDSGVGSDAGTVSIGGENNAAGSEANSNYGFAGNIDELRVYNAVLSTSQLDAVRTTTSSCSTATLVAEYRFEDGVWNGTAGELKDTAGAAGGPYNGLAQGSPVPTGTSSSPARSGNPGTCGYASMAGPGNGGGSFRVTGLPVSTTAGAQTTVAFWMYWNGTDQVAAVGWNRYVLGMASGYIGFNSDNNDLYGTSASGLANGWHHVVAVFTNGGMAGNKLYIDGVSKPLGQITGSTVVGNAVASTTLTIGGYGNGTGFRFNGRLDEVVVYNGAVDAATVNEILLRTRACAATLDHVEIRADSPSGLTCAPTTFTVAACRDASCSTPFTGGLSGTLTATGAGMTVAWPGGAAFSIAAGSSSTTVQMQLTTAGSVVLGASGLSTAPGSGTACNFGSPLCTFSASAAALSFDVPDHRAESSTAVVLRAVGASGGSCNAAFASSTRTVRLRCSHVDPSSGTLPVRVGGVALNSGHNAALACDGTGADLSLSFDGSGAAALTLLYADAGRMALSATYTGSAGTGDSGLTMTGSDSFTVAPFDFAVAGISSAAIAAGSPFSATIRARNYAGNTTPNFGRETTPEGVVLGFVRSLPTGAGAAAGTFSGSAGAFSNGVATATGLTYSEVGSGNVSARLASGSYLGSGMTLAGSSEGDLVWCANEGGSCVLPDGAVVTLYYQAWGTGITKAVAGLQGTVACNNATFGDPHVGWGKGCIYAATSGTRAWATAAATFKPHHFDLTHSAACSSFTYAGQPFGATVSARNAQGDLTLNYDGSANTDPNFAKATTLSDANALGLGSLSANTVPAAAFLAGVGSASPAYSFTTKATAPQSLVLRATDSDGVSSAGHQEPAMPLRSGRLRLANAFGKASAALQLAAATDYWSGSAWLLNSADDCTSVAGSSVALSNPRGPTGAASTATSSAGALAISSGSGVLTLAAPSPAGSGLSLDVAINLGSTGTDQSCQASHPATTGAGKPWLRAQNGSCAATADRDPAARATFGIFAPETRKTVHVRDIF